MAIEGYNARSIRAGASISGQCGINMDSDYKKMKKIIKLMRNEGVLHIKHAEMEISLAREALFPKNDSAVQSDSVFVENDFTDDALIDWSNISVGIEASS